MEQSLTPSEKQIPSIPGLGNQRDKRDRISGEVIACDGEEAVVFSLAKDDRSGGENYWAVGMIVSIQVKENRVIAIVHRVEKADDNVDGKPINGVKVYLELAGEIRNADSEDAQYFGGISNYPFIGATVHRIRHDDLSIIYETNSNSTITVGNLTQDSDIHPAINVGDMLSRHFAVVGTTGVGKSTAVSLLISKIAETRPNFRVLVLDPHNEFSCAFKERAVVIDAASLDFPYWIFKIDEMFEVIYRNRSIVAEEADLFRELISEARQNYATGMRSGSDLLQRKSTTKGSISDIPLPYRMTDVLKSIEHRLGQLNTKDLRPHLINLRTRLQNLISDPAFSFMFDNQSNGDALRKVLTDVFRIPQNGRPICVFEMSGLPSDVVNVIVAVLSRMAFDLGVTSGGALSTLVMCEEAHRYIPRQHNSGFQSVRNSIARIAKEGRKYGVHLGVITQRPSELDPTILSQCSTIFSMRLGNEHDKSMIGQAISGVSKTTISFLSALANRECIAFGEAISFPMRLRFENVASEMLPGASIYQKQDRAVTGQFDISLSAIISQMRNENTQKNYRDHEVTGYQHSPAPEGASSDGTQTDPYENPFADPQDSFSGQKTLVDPSEFERQAGFEDAAAGFIDPGNSVQPDAETLMRQSMASQFKDRFAKASGGAPARGTPQTAATNNLVREFRKK